MAKNIKGITIEISGDNKNLKHAINEISSVARKSEQSLKAIGRSLKFNPQSTELLVQKFNYLKKAIDDNKQKLEALKRAERELSKIPSQKEKWLATKREIVQTESKIKSFREQLKGSSVNAEALNGKLKDVNRVIRENEKSLRGVNSSLKKSPNSAGLLNAKFEALKNIIEANRQKLNALKSLEKEIANIKGNKEKWIGTKAEIAKTTDRLKGLERELKTVGKLKDGGMRSSFDKTAGVIDKNKDKLLALGTAGAGAFAGAVKASVDFESAFAGVRKTVDLTEDEFKQLEQNILDMSQQIPVSANELSHIGEVAGQLGISGVDNITNFTKVVSELSTATNLGAEEGAQSLARFMNVMGTSSDEVENLGSCLVNLGNNFATDEKSIMDMSQRLAGMGHQVGMTNSDVLGLASAMSSVGIEAEAGGTAMTQVMNKMSNAVSNGGKDLEAFARASGKSAGEFATAFKERPAEALKLLLANLDEVQKNGGNVNEVLETLGVTGIREADAVKRLAGAYSGDSGLSKALDIANQGYSENTALSKEAETRYKTLGSQLQILKNVFVNLATSIGNRLAPAVGVLAKGLKTMGEALQKSPEWVKTLVAVLITLTATIPFILVGISKLSGLFSTCSDGAKLLAKGFMFFGRKGAFFTTIVPKMVTGIKRLSGAFRALNLVMKANPILAIISLLLAIGFALYELYQKNATFRNKVNAIWASIKNGFTILYNWFSNLFQKMGSFWDSVRAKWQAGINKINALFSKIGNIFSSVKAKWQAGMSAIASIFSNLWNKIKSIFVRFASAWVSKNIETFNKVKDFISNILSGISDFFSNIWNTIYNVVSSVLNNVWNFISNIFNNIFSFLSNILTNVWNFISDTFNNVYETISNVLSNVWDFISNIFNNVYDTISSILSNVWDYISNVFNNIFSFISDIGSSIWNAISEAFTNVYNTISEMMSSAVDYISSINLYDIGVNIIQGLINGISNMASRLWSMVEDLAAGVTSSIKSILGIASPSKVMTEIGEFTGEGFVNGLSSYVDKTKNVARKIANASVVDTRGINHKIGMSYEVSQNRQVNSTLNDVLKEFSALKHSLNVTVVSELDGKEIARGTYKDIDRLNGINYRKLKGGY